MRWVNLVTPEPHKTCWNAIAWFQKNCLNVNKETASIIVFVPIGVPEEKGFI